MIERADILADVAPEKAIADALVQRRINDATMLEREIRDAASRLDAIGRDGLGGASVDAARARAAGGCGMWDVGCRMCGEIERGRDAAKKEVAAEARIDEQGVLADEAEPGAGGVLAFERGAGVDERSELGARVQLTQTVAEGVQS